MNKAFYFTFLFFLLTGCASMEQGRTANNIPTKKELYIGISTIETEKGVKVLGLTPNDPASKAGILTDDIIKQINGSDVSTDIQFYSLFINLDPNSDIELTVERNGKKKELFVSPKQRDVPIDIASYPIRKISTLLSRNKKVSLMIIVGEVSNAIENATKSYEWEKGVRNGLQSDAERFYLGFSEYPNFKIVDRNKTEELLKELNFSLSGAISDEFRAEVGKMTGATHILHVTFCRFPGRTGFNDVTTERLISVETGEIIGTATLSNEIK
ncbi:MAG: PDZ domain-containing protein [Candidatus Berkelbacteria bacterium]|nr:PDZ domain-containing protein [Candidatus Berkelbacteria bacterium]